MARTAKDSDFPVEVDGIGRFKFARRTQKDRYLIRTYYGQLTNDHWQEDGSVADMEAFMHATIHILAVEQPDGFSVDQLDPIMDDDIHKKIEKIFLALRQKEVSFRPPTTPGIPAEGAGSTP
jgi:hypothetical protein